MNFEMPGKIREWHSQINLHVLAKHVVLEAW